MSTRPYPVALTLRTHILSETDFTNVENLRKLNVSYILSVVYRERKSVKNTS